MLLSRSVSTLFQVKTLFQFARRYMQSLLKFLEHCTTSVAHLVLFPLPLKAMLLYTVLRGAEKVAMLADTYFANKHLIRHCF